jgi:hypothetical protein
LSAAQRIDVPGDDSHTRDRTPHPA